MAAMAAIFSLSIHMKNTRTLLFIPVVFAASACPVLADTITPFLGASSSTSSNYYFDNPGLSLSVASNGGGYTLTATGSGAFTFNAPNSGFSDAGTAGAYSLTANFTSTGTFVASGSQVTIYGTLNNLPSGAQPFATDGLLYSANLTGFGYNASQADIGFLTHFNTSWSNQALFTGGSTGESLYLFDQAGLSSGSGVLSSLIAAMQSGNLASLAGVNYAPVESVAIVPLPLPAILFGAGLTLVAAISRKQTRAPSSPL